MTESDVKYLDINNTNQSKTLEAAADRNGGTLVSEVGNNPSFVLEPESLPVPNHQKFSPILLVTVASVIAAFGGILFGYDIGIISGALLLLKKEFSLTCFDQEIVVSAVLIGALFASLVGGNVVDHCGRKCAIVLSSLLFIGGALTLLFSYNLPMLIAGRLIVGIAVSLSVTAECTYISEISPPNRRGMLVSLNEVGITVGFLLAYLCNYLFISYEDGWRYMFGAAIVPAVIQALGILFIPQSPHYLILKGKPKEAEAILKTLRQDNVEEEMKAISSALEEEKSRRYIDLFSSNNNMRARMALGMVLVFLQQFSGQANVLYYAPSVFQYFGYCTNASATLVTVGLGVVKVLATCFTVVIVDRVGRRFLLLTGCIMMAISIVVLGMLTVVNPQEISAVKCSSDTKNGDLDNITITRAAVKDVEAQKYIVLNADLTTSLSDFTVEGKDGQSEFAQANGLISDAAQLGNCTNCAKGAVSKNTSEVDSHCPDGNMSFTMKLISVISLMTFVCAYGISYGPVTWLVLSEIFPTALRGRAISVATCINWGSNIIVSMTFLDLLGVLGIGETFLVYGCICAGAAFFVFMCLPETKNKTLEEITCQLSQGNNLFWNCVSQPATANRTTMENSLPKVDVSETISH